jgi:hypothetical protein
VGVNWPADVPPVWGLRVNIPALRRENQEHFSITTPKKPYNVLMFHTCHRGDVVGGTVFVPIRTRQFKQHVQLEDNLDTSSRCEIEHSVRQHPM